MKICKNNFNVIVYPVTSCNRCAFGASAKNCYWLSIFKKASLECGGTVVNSTSNIFKL